MFRKENKRKYFIATLPKAGTHLLQKCIAELAGVKDSSIFLDNRLSFDKKNLSNNINDGIEVGVDNPNMIRRDLIVSYLNLVKNNRYITAHIPYSDVISNVLHEIGYIMFAIIRDPRDVAVSHVHFINKTKRHYLYDYYKSINDFKKCLMISIKGFEETNKGLQLKNIAERFTGVLNWSRYDKCHLVRFEDLVGEKGGGNAQVQFDKMVEIANFLEEPVNNDKIRSVCDRIFGGSYTFRKGQIGSWKTAFDVEHKEAFKQICGDLLIQSGYEKDMDW